ncbi:MAG: hypothetical protein VX913_16115 [Planctomycetota bacterium]|nr:hypothetical protein [Planctomycetota bacterium]
MDQVVDTETAREFMKETLDKVDAGTLADICKDVEAKSAWFQKTLAEEAIPSLTEDAFEDLLRRIFAARGKARQQLLAFPHDDMRGWLRDLLYGDHEVDQRVDTFIAHLDGMGENLRMDFAGEILHFASPDRHWLWARWMWDPRTRTGALPLVTTPAYGYEGETQGAIYMKVGRAVAFVHEVGEAAGFQSISRNIFGTDVFLSCVYVVYAYTVLKMRMTNEFNKVMPGLPEFSRRLLGVNRKGQRKAPVGA